MRPIVVRSGLALAVIGVALVGMGVMPMTEQARALSCAPISHEKLERAADVIFDGVPLSGPENGFELASPARFKVLGYLKGRGPEVVSVATTETQVLPGSWTGTFGVIAGLPPFLAGEPWRIYGQVPKAAGNSARLGVASDRGCGGSRLINADSALHDGPRTVGLAPDGVTRWRSQVLRGAGDLRCLRLWLRKSGYARDTECADIGRGVAQMAIARDPDAGLAVAITGRGVIAVEIRSPLGSQLMNVDDEGLGVIVLPPHLDPDSIEAVVSFRDGSETSLGASPSRALADGPGEGPEAGQQWEAVSQPAHPARDGLVCVRWGPVDPDPFPPYWGECGDLARTPLFFAARGYYEFLQPDPAYTAVFGAAGPEVSSISIAGPEGERPLELSDQGRAFITVFSGGVERSEISLRAELTDGSTIVFSNRRDANLRTPDEPWAPRGLKSFFRR